MNRITVIYTGNGLRGAVQALQKSVERSRLNHERQRQIRQIEALDDYLLRDIALDRSEIVRAVRLANWTPAMR